MRKVIPVKSFKIEHNNNTICATLKYHGKDMKGVAVCRSGDEFDVEKGEYLAMARSEAAMKHARTVHARKQLRKIRAEIQNLSARAEAYELRVCKREAEEKEAFDRASAIAKAL